MNLFKEEKPLIEWEKELDVWLVDLLPHQHYEKYNKMDGFQKIGCGNYYRGWTDEQRRIYSEYKLGLNQIRLCSSYSTGLLDIREKPLIEWEKELGYWIYCISSVDHTKKCTREDAKKIIYTNCFVKAWNDEAEELYNNYMELFKEADDNITIIDNPIVIPFEEKKKGIFEKFRDNQKEKNSKRQAQIAEKRKEKEKQRQSLKQEREIQKQVRIAEKQKEKANKKQIKIENKEQQVKVRNNAFKAAMAVGLSLVTAVTTFGFSKTRENKVLENDTTNIISDNIQKNDNILFTTGFKEIMEKTENNVHKEKLEKQTDVSQENKQVINEPKTKKKVKINDNIQKNKNANVEQNNNEENNVVQIGLGDIITLDDDFKVYDDIYDAVNKEDGLESLYPNTTYRYVNYVALDDNGKIIYSNNEKEICNYQDKGAKVVGVCTSIDNKNLEGYYNADDVVVKVKKIK